MKRSFLFAVMRQNPVYTFYGISMLLRKPCETERFGGMREMTYLCIAVLGIVTSRTIYKYNKVYD